MPVLLYGLTLSADAAPASVRGIEGTSVRVLDCGALAAIVGDVVAPVTATLPAIREHDAVLQRFVDAGATVSAARFGQLFDDDDACRAAVQRRGESVARVLEEHRGTVEMRVLLPAAPEPLVAAAPSAAGPGRAYLESLRAREPALTKLALRPMLGQVVHAERVEALGRGSAEARGVAFAHLVLRSNVDRYRVLIRELPALASAQVVGPLALYSFAPFPE